ncbi:MAG: hypothetical protein NDJ90_15440 [Oligoflexia bacterium]|nr:hypothetical protein [Oligoflexia bacterium]
MIRNAADFKLEPGKIPVLFVMPYAPSFSQVMLRLEAGGVAQVAECPSTLDAASLGRRLGSCLIVAFVAKEEDSVRLLTLQKLLDQQLRQKAVRILVTSAVREKELIFRISTQLDAEILPEPVTEKSLLFKIDRLLKLLPAPGLVADPLLGGELGERKVERDSQPQLIAAPPLELESDCWLNVPGATRLLGGRWIVKLRGPFPQLGSWGKIESGEPGLPAWQWMPNDEENDPFIRESGAWVFFGQKPEFIDEAWTFVGKRLGLAFYYEGENYGSRFETDELANLRLTEDSEASRRAAAELMRLAKAIRYGAPPQAGEEAARPGSAIAQGVSQGAPLSLESDCWLLEGRAPRRVATKWMISLAGPPAHLGKWVPIEEEGGGAQRKPSGDRYWQWMPHDPENDPFLKEEGAWVFYGLMPKYGGELWSFVGERPELAFYYDGQSYGAKLSAPAPGALVIATDSPSAEKARSVIDREIDRVVAAKADPRRPVSAAPLEVKIPQREFGAPGGGWEVAASGSQMRRWFVYLPAELLGDPSVDIQKLPVYWLYLGSVPPVAAEGGGESLWVFQDRKPQSVARFSDLAPPLQKFLLQYFASQDVQARALPAEDGVYVVKAAAPVAPAATPLAETRSYKLPLEAFGAPGGEWEAVSGGSAGRRWFAYVPPEVLAGSVENIRKLPVYWLYFGPTPPAQVVSDTGGELVFQERKPQSYTSFSDLLRPVQEFFLQYFGEKAAEAPAAATETAVPAGLGGVDESYGLRVFHDDGIVLPRKVLGGFRLREADLGEAGGEWEVADVGSEGRRWFVFIPADFFDSGADIRKLGAYWLFFGAQAPRRVADDAGPCWHFEERSPQVFEAFADLQRPIQVFLMDYFGFALNQAEARSSPEAEAEDAERGAPSLRPAVSADDTAEPGPDTSHEAGESADTLVSVDAFASADTSVNADFVASDEGAAQPQLRPAAEPARAPTLLSPNRPFEGAPALRPSARGAPEEETALSFKLVDGSQARRRPEEGETLNYAKPKRERSGDFAEQPVESVLGMAEVAADLPGAPRLKRGVPQVRPGVPQAQPRAPQAVPDAQAASELSASTPSLSSLAVALLMSELLRRRELEPKEMAHRFSQCVAAAFGGSHVELWARAEGRWFCTGASDGVDGAFAETFNDLPPDFPAGGHGGASLAPVRNADGSAVLGAIVIGGGHVPVDYLCQVARSCVGLLATLTGNDRGAAAS